MQHHDRSFGMQLRRYRERAGLTQEALAERAGLTANAISALESGGRRRAYPHTVAALAQALQLSDAEQADLFAARAAPPRAVPPATHPAVASAPLPAAHASTLPWVVQTKLHVPRLRDDFLPRQRLLDVLHGAVVSRRLTLVSAPAGYGKTTLLAALQRRPNLALAWFSLTDEDNDPTAFLATLIAAVQRLDPRVGATAQTVLVQVANPASELQRVIGVLINDIVALHADPLVLVLDDLHHVPTSACCKPAPRVGLRACACWPARSNSCRPSSNARR